MRVVRSEGRLQLCAHMYLVSMVQQHQQRRDVLLVCRVALEQMLSSVDGVREITRGKMKD